MDEKLNSYDEAVLKTLARVRGFRPEAVVKYPQLSSINSVEATRKRLERLAQKGLLAKSSLPAGPQIFRLSRKGVRLAGAPASFADNPTQGVAYDMIAASSYAWKVDDVVFLTREEFIHTCQQLYPGFTLERFPGRFLLRVRTVTPENPHQPKKQTRLDFWLAEFKPADQLASRIKVIIEHLTASNAFFALAIRLRLFGVTVAVPSQGVKASLEQKDLPTEVTIVVLDELRRIFSAGV